jgi:hypothetical protein
MKTHRPILAFAAMLIAATGPVWAGAKRPVVVELYTSQGCSSCPPADAILARLADRKDVIALSLPITYWDMLGWKDTLASDTNTRRQKAYAQVMGRGGVYTPQMIVDGVDDVVGSREAAVDSVIETHESDPRGVSVALTGTPRELHVLVGQSSTGTSEHGGDATIWIFQVMAKATVAIHAGENEGRSMTYRNIVRDVRAAGVWKGQPVSLDLPRQEIMNDPHNLIAVIVQENGYGRVIGAAMLGGQ